MKVVYFHQAGRPPDDLDSLFRSFPQVSFELERDPVALPAALTNAIFAATGNGDKTAATLLNSPLYRTILESLAPNGSFTFTKKPIVFPNGQLGLEVDTGGPAG